MSRKGVVTLFLLFFLVGCSGAVDRWEQIQRAGVLRVGVDPTFPPFANIEEEQFVGYEIELMELLGAQLGVEIQFMPIAYDGLYDSLKTGQVDLLLSALVYRPEMSAEFAYTESYFDVGTVVATVAGRNEEIGQLAGEKVGVEMGSQAHMAGLSLRDQLDELDLVTFATADQLLAAVEEQVVVAGLVDRISALLYIQSGGQVMIWGEAIEPEPLHMVVRTGDKKLLQALNVGMNDLKKAGVLEELNGRWFHEK